MMPTTTTQSAPRLRTVTLGCKVNQYETEFVRQALTGIGYRDAERRRDAPICASSTPARSRTKAIPKAGRRFANWRREIPARGSS